MRSTCSHYRAIDRCGSSAQDTGMKLTLNVNGESRSVDVDPRTPLVWVLRDELELKGTKFGCGMGLCGACTVHVDGVPIALLRRRRSRPSAKAQITTIEAIGARRSAARLQAAWLERRRGAVRLLPGGPDHVGHRAADAQRRSRPTRRSTRPWPATSAAAPPTRGSATRSSARPDCRRPTE